MRAPRRPSAWIAAMLLIILAPLFALIALAVALSMGRPVLFRQARSGQGGRSFRMVKFRTMRELRDAGGALLPDAARTTRLGAFLRRSRLDELPELLNVARGEMNWVGPRPLLPETIDSLGVRGMIRGSVRPGLTGLAQVSGNTLLSLDEKVAIDIHYVRHHGPRADLAILAQTLLVVLTGERRKLPHDLARHPRRSC